jgi:hypothetical protein
MIKRFTVQVDPDGTPILFPNPPNGETACIIDRESIEAEVLRRLADKVEIEKAAMV